MVVVVFVVVVVVVVVLFVVRVAMVIAAYTVRLIAIFNHYYQLSLSKIISRTGMQEGKMDYLNF